MGTVSFTGKFITWSPALLMCDCYTVYQCIQLTLWKWGNMLVVILCIVTRVVMKLKLANIKDENNGSKFWVGAP